MNGISLHNADCMDYLPSIPDASIHAVIADPPYGTTKCAWDTIIPLEPLWQQLRRVLKPHGAIVLFCTQPFTTILIGSQIAHFKYCWTWDKGTGKGHLVAKIRPLQQTEDIAVFGYDRIRYNPIVTLRDKPELIQEKGKRSEIMGGTIKPGGYQRDTDFRYPKTLLRFPWSRTTSLHPTEKPVALIEYLIYTYTDPGDTVLDFCFGSGTTAVACIKSGRRFTGSEIDPHYFSVAQQRTGSPPL